MSLCLYLFRCSFSVKFWMPQNKIYQKQKKHILAMDHKQPYLGVGHKDVLTVRYPIVMVK